MAINERQVNKQLKSLWSDDRGVAIEPTLANQLYVYLHVNQSFSGRFSSLMGQESVSDKI